MARLNYTKDNLRTLIGNMWQREHCYGGFETGRGVLDGKLIIWYRIDSEQFTSVFDSWEALEIRLDKMVDYQAQYFDESSTEQSRFDEAMNEVLYGGRL